MKRGISGEINVINCNSSATYPVVDGRCRVIVDFYRTASYLLMPLSNMIIVTGLEQFLVV